MSTTLYAGTRTAKLLQVGNGYADAGTVYNLLGRSERIAPAGPEGECIFTALYVTTRHFAGDVSFRLTPLIDNVALAAQTITLVGAATTTGNRQTRELPLSLPYTRSAVEILRTYPRGTWIEVLVETAYGSAPTARQIIESIVCEYEPVRETQSGEAR